MKSLPPIRTPFLQHWREFRIEYLPKVTFVGAVALAVVLWQRWALPVEMSTPEAHAGRDATNAVVELDRPAGALVNPNESSPATND